MLRRIGLATNMFALFAQMTACASAQVLLRPLSHTTAFYAQLLRATSTWQTTPCTRVATPGGRSASCVSVGLFDSEVTSLGRFTARSAWVCAAFRQAILSWCLAAPDFPLRKPEAQSTAPHTDVRSLAPSLQNLTGKRLLSVFVCAFHS